MIITYEYIRVSGGYHTTSDRIPDFMMGWVSHYPPVITICIGGINLPFPVMGGLWHCFNHMFDSSKVAVKSL